MTRRGSIVILSSVCLILFGGYARTETSGQKLAQRAGKTLVGKPAPRLKLTTIDGDTIDLGQLYGKKAVYLKFWATWCTPCREQMPHFQRTYDAAGPDLAVIAIDVGFNDSVDEIRSFRQKTGIAMPIVFDDGRAGGAFHLRVTPQHIVIGRDGRIQYVGHLADAQLDAALLAARTASPAGASGPIANSHEAPVSVHYGIGDRLPARSLKLLDGGTMPFRDTVDGRTTVLVFLSPWCESYLATTRPVVSANCRRMREQVSALSDTPRIRWLGIASGLWATSEDLNGYRTKNQVRMPLALDESGTLFRAFDVNEVPQSVIADEHGRIVRIIRGADLRDPATLRSAISQR
jgi:peroxiredoxin